MMMWAGAQRIVAAAKATLFGVPQLNSLAGAVGAAGSLLAAVLGPTTPILLGYLAVMMLGDLMAGLLRALRRPDERVDAAVFAGGMIGKLLRVLIVVPAVGIEKVMASMGVATPQHALPMLVVCALILFECASIVQNIQAAEGKILPVVLMRRALQAARFELEAKPEAPKHERKSSPKS